MKTIIVISCLLALVYGSPVGEKHLHRPEPRIVGGSLSEPHDFPYQVGMDLDTPIGHLWCGGSLISDQYILTAAHCLFTTNSANVLLGGYDITKPYESGRQMFAVKKSDFIIHEKWNPYLIQNDIALIKLPHPVKLTDEIQTIKLPSRNFENVEGKIAITTGWGQYTDKSEKISPLLLFVDVEILPISVCKKYFPYMITSANICTSGSNGKSACHGDSGGPLIVLDNQTELVVAGITSFGSPDGCEIGWPGVYTRVSSYLDWIENNTGIHIQ